MDGVEALITNIQECGLKSPHSEVSLCRLMRRPVRALLDHDGAVVQLQTHHGSRCIIGFDIAPRLVRALRLAACLIDGGAYFTGMCSHAPHAIGADRLRTLPLGPHLRSLASGHLILHRHADPELLSQSLFVFTGIPDPGLAGLRHILNAIVPVLHYAFFSVYHGPSSPAPTLTFAENAICRLLLQGASNKAIARMLGKSETTVRNQLHMVFRKLGVNTRTSAAVRLKDLGLPDVGPGQARKRATLVYLYH